MGAKKRGSGFLTLSLGHRGRSPSLPPSSFPPCPCQDSLEQGRQGRRVSDRPESVGLWAKFGKVQLAQQRRCERYRGIVEKVNARLFNLAQPTQHIKKTLCLMSKNQQPANIFAGCQNAAPPFFGTFFPSTQRVRACTVRPPILFPVRPEPYQTVGTFLLLLRRYHWGLISIHHGRKGRGNGRRVRPSPSLSLSIHRFPFPFFPPLALSPRIPLLHPHASQHGMSFAKTDTAKN